QIDLRSNLINLTACGQLPTAHHRALAPTNPTVMPSTPYVPAVMVGYVARQCSLTCDEKPIPAARVPAHPTWLPVRASDTHAPLPPPTQLVPGETPSVPSATN